MQRSCLPLRYAVLMIMLGASLLTGAATPTLAAPLRQGSELTTLRIATPPITTIDPTQISRFDPHSRDLVENLFVGLTRYNPQTHEIEPMIAKSWSVSEDGLTWRFELRDDVQWVHMDPDSGEVSAVRPVVAGDFVYSVQRGCDPLRPSPVTTNLMLVQGCHTVANAFPEVITDLFIAREIKARAVGPYTLEFDLVFPAAYFLTLTSTPEFRPLARETVATAEDWTEPGAILTNGPFVLALRDSTGLALVRNSFWPDSYTGNIEQIDISFTGEFTTATTLAAAGQIDLARLDATEIENARSRLSDLLHTAPGTTLTFIGFSYERALVDVPEVRRALSLALDREALVQQLLPDQALAVSQFTPAGMVAEPTFDGLAYDPVRAQAAFETAGFSGCNNIPEKMILLVADDDPFWAELGQAVIQQWADHLGCNPALFEVRPLPRTTMIEISHATYDSETVTRSHMWVISWIADYPDTNAWLNDVLHCRYGYIRNGRVCEQTDGLLDAAGTEMDTAQRAELYSQVETQLFGPNGTFPVLPLFRSTSAWVQQPWLTDVNEAGPARFDLWTLDTQAQAGS